MKYILKIVFLGKRLLDLHLTYYILHISYIFVYYVHSMHLFEFDFSSMYKNPN